MSWLDSLFSVFSKPSGNHPVHLYNTMSQKKEHFIPLQNRTVKMYNCGPTVYARQHIGNLSMFVFADVLRRTLEGAKYTVKQVINFTDVGHLAGDNEGDADSGEDRMTKGLKAAGKKITIENMLALGERFSNVFVDDLRTLNIDTNHISFPRASAYIPGQIAMVKTLQEKGYAYVGTNGVYFDTALFADYGKLGAINIEGLKEGARIGVSKDKRHSTDFLLWKFDPKLGWESPWGMGFPGWHIECSAMIRAILGEQIDIHTGGIEHIPVHHNNEIAQSEAVSGKKPFVRFWMHRAHLQIESSKISRSEGNTLYLSDLVEKGFHPSAFRYLLLTAHYRTPSNFTWESLGAAQSAYLKLRKLVQTLPHAAGAEPIQKTMEAFRERIYDDLDTAGAIAKIWELLKEKNHNEKRIRATLLMADTVLGLGLDSVDEAADTLLKKEFGEVVSMAEVPQDMQNLLAEREAARAEKKWTEADAARKKIEDLGYEIEDTNDGPRLKRVS